MPTELAYENAVHQLMLAAQQLRTQLEEHAPAEAARLEQFLAGLEFLDPGPGAIEASWESPTVGTHRISLGGAHFPNSGEKPASQESLSAAGQPIHPETSAAVERNYFAAQLRELLEAAQVAPLAELAKWFARPADPDAERPADGAPTA